MAIRTTSLDYSTRRAERDSGRRLVPLRCYCGRIVEQLWQDDEGVLRYENDWAPLDRLTDEETQVVRDRFLTPAVSGIHRSWTFECNKRCTADLRARTDTLEALLDEGHDEIVFGIHLG